MNNALATQDQRARLLLAEVSEGIERSRKTFQALLPKEITPDRMKALALTSMRKTPKLLLCDAHSILQCVYEAAKLGLSPDTASADCHLIPRKGKATFQVGYKGLMKLARRAVPNIPIKAEHVCANDLFDWEEGLVPILKHRRAPAGERGKVTHAYAIATMPSGPVFKVVDEDDIRRARKTSFSTAWDHHTGAMFEKTAVKRLCKTLPSDDPGAAERLFRAIELDNAVDDDRPQDVGVDLDLDEDIVDAEATEWQCSVCGAKDDDSHEKGCPETPA